MPPCSRLPLLVAAGLSLATAAFAELQPASDAALQQVADLLTKDKTLKIEVQGHTDNVGGDTYD